MTDVFVHSQGLNESDAVGVGTRVWAFAHVAPGAVVGAHCNIGEGAFIEGGARIGDHVTVKNGVSIWDRVHVHDFVFLGPHVVFTNDRVPRSHPDYRTPREAWRPTVVGEGASLGANATVVCGVTLGPWCLVGAGSVVVRNVPAHALVVGNPARRIAWVCRCGARLPETLACEACGLAFEEAQEGLKARATAARAVRLAA